METDASTRALLTRAELADVLRVSLSTIDRLRRRGAIQSVQLVPNGRVAYKVEMWRRCSKRHPDPFRPTLAS